MKIAVVGAGAVGGLVAWHLAQAGIGARMPKGGTQAL